MTLHNVSHRIIAAGMGITRRAVSYTPTVAMTLHQWSFWGKRILSPYHLGASGETNTIEWEIRSDAGGGTDKPATTAALSSGTFDYRYTSVWAMDRLIQHTVHLSTPLELSASTQYWFILKSPSDTDNLIHPLAWLDTWPTADVATVHVAYYAGGVWTNDDAGAYDLTLSILDAQAGKKWQVVVDGLGYMTPDNLASYRCDQAQGGLAATRGGQSEYSQLRYPYTALSQDDWTSGGGQLVMEDPNAFLVAKNIDTTVAHQLILGPQVFPSSIEYSRAAEVEYAPSDKRWVFPLPLVAYSTPTSIKSWVAQKFTLATDLTITKFTIATRRSPHPLLHSLQAAIYTDNAGSPGTAVVGLMDVTASTHDLNWRVVPYAAGVVSAGTYWIVVKTSQVDNLYPEHYLLFDQTASAPGGRVKISADGLTWGTGPNISMCFQLNDGAYQLLNGNVSRFTYGEVNNVSALYVAAGKKVYQWSAADTHWDDISTSIDGAADVTTNDITDIVCFANKLFVAQGYTHHACSWDGTGWTDEADNYKYFCIGKGYLWASTSANTVQKYNGASWSSDITIGESIYEITAIQTYAGRLLVGKEDGIWEIDEKDLAKEYTVFRNQASPLNCKGMVQWSGMLFIPVMTSIWRWTGSSYREVGPSDHLAGPTEEWPNRIKDMCATSSLLYAMSSPEVATGYGGIMAYNGLGWHYLMVHTLANRTAVAAYVTSELPTAAPEIRVWYSEGQRVFFSKWPLHTNNRYDWTSATYHMNYGYILTSWYDGGLKDALKFWNRVAVIADVPSGTDVEVFFAKDGEDWRTTSDFIYLGKLTSASKTANGEYVLYFPDGITAKSVQLIFMFSTDDCTLTPRIKAYNVEAVVRQQPAYTHSFRLKLSDNVIKMDGSVETTRTGIDMWEELQRTARTDAPVLISFPWATVRGFISNLSLATYSYKADEGSQTEWERVAVVTVIEAT